MGRSDTAGEAALKDLIRAANAYKGIWFKRFRPKTVEAARDVFSENDRLVSGFIQHADLSAECKQRLIETLHKLEAEIFNKDYVDRWGVKHWAIKR